MMMDDLELAEVVQPRDLSAKLRVRKSRYTSDANCFDSDGAEQLIAEIYYDKRYRTLAEYQQAVNQDLGSREVCGPLPEKIEVHQLHATTLAYPESARETLAMDSPREPDPDR